MIFERYFKGGPEVQEARARRDRLSRKSSLSNTDRNTIAELRTVTRRHMLRRMRDAAIVGGAVVAGGGFLLFDSLTSNDSLEPNPTEANRIRKQIREYEDAHRDQVTTETVNTIYNLTASLYEATFGKKTTNTKFLPVTEQELKKYYPEGNLPDAPQGQAGVIIFSQDKDGHLKEVQTIAFTVYLGKENMLDPNVNKLSVIRAVLMHEFVHTQVQPKLIEGTVTAGDTPFRARYARGLKWVANNAPKTDEPAWFFEEINNQLLTEYLNDPSGQDPIWDQIRKSPLYSKSFDKDYFSGKEILSTIYQKLGITIKQVEDAHSQSDVEAFLKHIDELITARGISLPSNFTSSIIKMNVSEVTNTEPEVTYIKPLETVRDLVLQSTP